MNNIILEDDASLRALGYDTYIGTPCAFVHRRDGAIHFYNLSKVDSYRVTTIHGIVSIISHETVHLVLDKISDVISAAFDNLYLEHALCLFSNPSQGVWDTIPDILHAKLESVKIP